MRSLRFLPVLLAIAVAASAQIPGPPEALKKFDRILGNWEGSGTARMVPGGQAYPWTSRSTARRVLDGHFILEDVSVTTGPGMPNMEFRTVYAWDAAQERLVSYVFGNDGSWRRCPVHFTADGKLVDATVTVEDGKIMADRWVSEFSEDAASFQGWRSVEGGEPFPYVQGSMKHGGDGFTLTAESAKVSGKSPSEKLAAFAAMAGDWNFEGKMTPQPGASSVRVAGHEKVYPILGGHVFFCDVVGDENPDGTGMPAFRGFSFLGWDENEKCLKNVGFNNSGEFHENTVHPRGDGDLIMLSATPLYRGIPTSQRMTLRCGKDEIRIVSDTFQADRPAARTFEGKFTRRTD